jgi:hypothetical protein
MLSYQTNHSARSPWVRASFLTLAVLCLSVSGTAYGQALTPNQQAAVTNLQQASNALKTQITLGATYSSAVAASAQSGAIVDPAAHQNAAITTGQVSSYNQSLSTFQATNFYTASQFFTDQANLSRTQMQAAISSLADATADLQKVIAVNQTLQNIIDAPAARAAQQVVANTGIGTEITNDQLSAYNTSLADVGTYSAKTAAFIQAANSQSISGNVDTFAAQYNKPLDYATAAFSYATASVTVSWGDLVLSQEGVLSQYRQSAEAFYSNLDAN